MSRRAFLIVLDGLGIGRAADQDAYGDGGSDTLGNTLARAAADFRLPNLEGWGLGRCAPLARVPPAPAPRAAWGTAQPVSAGKDSTTGHWELTGLVLDRPAKPVAAALLDKGFLVGTATDPYVLRLAPPAVTPLYAVDLLADALGEVLAALAEPVPQAAK